MPHLKGVIYPSLISCLLRSYFCIKSALSFFVTDRTAADQNLQSEEGRADRGQGPDLDLVTDRVHEREDIIALDHDLRKDSVTYLGTVNLCHLC